MAESEKITIKDIATIAGVSKSTVSRYLNGRKELLNSKTWDRIEHAVKMTNYVPNDMASNLKKKTTNLIGLVVANISHPFSTAIINGVKDVLDKKGYTLLISISDDNPEKEAENIHSLLSKNVSGLIVNTCAYENNNLISTACKGTPIVLCDRQVNNYSFDIVSTDHEAGMNMLVQHLYDCGYTRPVLFGQSWQDNSTRIHRRQGFIDAVREIYDYNPEVNGDIYEISEDEFEKKNSKLNIMLDSLDPGDRPALIGTNSLTTASAAHAILEQGLRIPEDIGLCGPEDWDWNGRMNWPTMIRPNVTTLKIPSTDIGRQAAKLMMGKLNNPSVGTKEVLLPSTLNIRRSTALPEFTLLEGSIE